MRDYVLLVILAASVPVSFLRPIVGIYLWYWVAFMNPHRLAWGLMYHFPVALLVGTATLLGSVVFGSFRRSSPRNAQVPLLISLCLIFTLSTALAMFPDLAWAKWQSVMKAMLMTVLTIYLITTRERLRILLLVIVLSIGFWAVKAVPWAIATGGVYMIRGPEGSSIASNNDIAMAFNMVLPLAVFFSRSEARKAVRWGFLGVALATAGGVFLSYSRGALLGICAVGLMLVLRSRHRIRTIFLIAIVASLAAVLMPSKWETRMHTIETYEKDESAMGRIHTWQFAWGLALSNPLLGGGFQAFRANPLDFDAHSNYFGMLGEQGFLGLGVYLLLIVSAFATLGRIRKITRGIPQFLWYRDCAGALQASIAGYCVNGLTLGQQYMDLFYALIAVVAILQGALSTQMLGFNSAAQATVGAMPEVEPVAGTA